MSKKLEYFLNSFFKILISVLAVLNLFIYSRTYFNDGVDFAEIQGQSIYVVISVFIITAIIFVVFRYLKHKYYIVVILLLISLITKSLWLYNWPLKYYYDMNSVFTQASDIYTIPGYLPIEGFHYLKVYDYNIPLVLLNLFYYNVAGVNGAWNLARTVNLVSLLLIDFGIYLTASKLFNQNTGIRALLLSVLFFPFTGFVAVVYNDVISAVLFLYAVYFFIRYTKDFRTFDFVLTVVLLLIGNTFRSIGVIVLIAFTIYLLIIKWKKAIIFALVCMISITLSNFGLNQLYYKIGILDSSDGSMRVPISHYLAIGSSKGVNDKTPGYYYPYLNEYFFSVDEYDPAEFSDVSDTNLKNNLNELGIIGGASHYFTKYVLQWTDGTFETALINDLIVNKDDSPVTLDYYTGLYYLVTGTEIIRNLIITYSNAYWLMILMAVAVLAFKSHKQQLLILKLFIMGIMAFYVLWEISPHYSFAVLPYFIILGTEGLGILYELLVETVLKEKK